MNKVEWKFPMTFRGNKDEDMPRKDDLNYPCSKTKITGTILHHQCLFICFYLKQGNSIEVSISNN